MSKTTFYEIDAIRNTIINGDALSELKRIPDNSIDCFVTSSPYYALRTYGTTPVIWPPTENTLQISNGEFSLNELLSFYRHCQQNNAHEFETTHAKLHAGRGGKDASKLSQRENIPDTPIEYAFCRNCGAWRGELGQEPTPDLFLDHLMLIFREVHRVLKPSGTCWVNLGDTYSGSGGAGGDYNKGGIKEGQPRYIGSGKRGKVPAKSLLNIPKKFAIRMVEELGFILRNDIIWHKPNVLPQSAKDKFTPDFEYVFFFTKSQKYYFETQYEPLSEAIIEKIKRRYTNKVKTPFAPIGGIKQSANCDKCDGKGKIATLRDIGYIDEQCNACNGTGKVNTNATYSDNEYTPSALGRQKRTVWRISTKPFKGAHFAVYPKDLIRPMLRAGCPREICTKCGAMFRTTYKETRVNTRPGKDVGNAKSGTNDDPNKEIHRSDLSKYRQKIIREPISKATCKCNAPTKPGIVLDCFIGSGTTRLVAQELGLDFIGIELKPDYAQMARTRQYRLLELPKRKLFVEVMM